VDKAQGIKASKMQKKRQSRGYGGGGGCLVTGVARPEPVFPTGQADGRPA